MGGACVLSPDLLQCSLNTSVAKIGGSSFVTEVTLHRGDLQRRCT